MIIAKNQIIQNNLGQNNTSELVVNGGFEEADDFGAPVGWRNGNGGKVMRCLADPLPRSGKWMACFEESSVFHYVYQTIDISTYANAVDSSNAIVTATGYFQAQHYESSAEVYLKVKFLNGKREEIPRSGYDSGTRSPAFWAQYGV